MSVNHLIRGRCEHCGAFIEFPEEYLGLSRPCQHCNRETLLVETDEPETIPMAERAQAPFGNLPSPTISPPSSFQWITGGCQLFIVVALAAMFGYWHPWRPEAAPERDWEYCLFQWNETDFDPDRHPGEVYGTFLHLHGNETLDGPDGREEPSLDNLLNSVGDYGWELVCFDGKNYIVKRRRDQRPAPYFYVEQHWKRLAASPNK